MAKASPKPKSQPPYCSIPGVDPYIDWALGPGRAHFFPEGQDEWMSVLLTLSNITVQDFASGRAFFDGPRAQARWTAAVRIPQIYFRPEDKGVGELTLSGFVTKDFFGLLRTKARVRVAVVRVTLGLPLDQASLPLSRPSAAKGKVTS